MIQVNSMCKWQTLHILGYARYPSLFLLFLSIILDALFYFILDALIVMANLVLLQPKKVFVFEDAKQRAWQWKNAIEDLQYSQKN